MSWGAEKDGKQAEQAVEDAVGFGRDLGVVGRVQRLGIEKRATPPAGVFGELVQVAGYTMTIEQADEWMSIARSVITLAKKIRAANDPKQEQLPLTEAPAEPVE